ncbi:hypothetical protein L7F22_062522 [Adiantum nelumboides]|nr:hypothetical protein [Adiantum nelumboides]
MDLQALIMRHTFDTTCQLTFGTDPACLDSSKLERTDFFGNSASTLAASDYDSSALHDGPMHTTYAKVPEHLIEDFVQAFQVSLTIIAERFLVPNIVWNLKRSLKVGSERRLMNALAMIDKFASFAIEQSKRDLESGKDRKDPLARFMLLSKDLGEVAFDRANNDEQEGLNMTDAFLKDILLSFILAGRDAVASGITFTMWLLSIHPRVEKEVLKEINGIIRDRETNHVLECGSNVASFTYNEVRKMHYLQDVISETMILQSPWIANMRPKTILFLMEHKFWRVVR